MENVRKSALSSMWEKELEAQFSVRHYIFTGSRCSRYRKWVLKNPDVILHVNQDQGLNFKPFLWYLPKSISDDNRKDEGSCGKKSKLRVQGCCSNSERWSEATWEIWPCVFGILGNFPSIKVVLQGTERSNDFCICK